MITGFTQAIDSLERKLEIVGSRRSESLVNLHNTGPDEEEFAFVSSPRQNLDEEEMMLYQTQDF